MPFSRASVRYSDTAVSAVISVRDRLELLRAEELPGTLPEDYKVTAGFEVSGLFRWEVLSGGKPDAVPV